MKRSSRSRSTGTVSSNIDTPNAPKRSKRDVVSQTAPIYRPLHDREVSHQLLISLDIGTSSIKAATGVRREASLNPLEGVVDSLPLQYGNHIMPATMAILPASQNSFEEAEFVFGDDVTENLKYQNITLEHIWHSLKQCCVIMNPIDPTFADKKKSLEETQQRHEMTLMLAKRFDKITINFRRSGVQTYYPKAARGSGLQTFNTIRDILSIYLRWILEMVQSSILTLSCLSDQVFKDFFESRKIRIGVAVPDVLSPSMVSAYQQVLVESGYGQSVEMLSEARCAAISVAKEFLSERVNTGSLGKYGSIDIDVCDSGHGTTDMSTIRATKNGALLQFEFVIESTGNSTGGKVVSDTLKQILRQKMKPYLSMIVPGISSGILLEEKVANAFLDSFHVGIEDAKPYYMKDRATVGIAYDGKASLRPRTLPNGIEVSYRSLKVPAPLLKQSYDRFLEAIIRQTTQLGSTMGLLERHYSKIHYHKEAAHPRELFCVGGAFMPEYVRECVISAAARFPLLADSPPQFFGVNSNKYVAQGGVLMLSDKALCDRRFHSESLGCVVSCIERRGDDLIEKPDRVDWFFMIGQRVTDRADFTQRFMFNKNEGYTIELKHEDPASPNFSYPVQMKWMAARTADLQQGQTYDASSKHPKIHIFPGIICELDQATCERIGWTQEDGAWKLEFEFELRVLLEGNVVRCFVTIPKDGTFAGCSDCIRFESRLGANISNLCHEDLFKMEDDDNDCGV